jgi:hypothetical protein
MPWRLRSVPVGTDNRAVPRTSWRKRIARAEELTVHYHLAAELLDFYVRLAGFQESLSLLLDRAPAGGFSDPLEADLLLDGSTVSFDGERVWPLPLGRPCPSVAVN